jgi:hypothetical protein
VELTIPLACVVGLKTGWMKVHASRKKRWKRLDVCIHLPFDGVNEVTEAAIGRGGSVGLVILVAPLDVVGGRSRRDQLLRGK